MICVRRVGDRDVNHIAGPIQIDSQMAIIAIPNIVLLKGGKIKLTRDSRINVIPPNRSTASLMLPSSKMPTSKMPSNGQTAMATSVSARNDGARHGPFTFIAVEVNLMVPEQLSQ